VNRALEHSSSGRSSPIRTAAPETAAASFTRRWSTRIFHAVWILAAILAVAVFLASLTGYSIWLRGENPVTPGPDPISGFHVLSGLTSLVSALTCLGLALVLFLRKRHDPMALFVSFYIMTYGVIMSGPLENLNPLLPGASDAASGLIQPAMLLAPTVWLVVLLPDGQCVPPWTRWVGVASIASLALLPLLDARSISTGSTPLAQLMYAIWVGLFVLALAGQVYRYRRVSSPTQRAQTRWLVFGMMVWSILMFAQALPYLYLNNLPPGAPVPNWAAAAASLWWVTMAVIPVTLSLSILRHRLYDIDLIINRALLYGAMTAIVAGMYSASISLFQRLFIALTGERSDAAIVLTTLILASTFTPIKTRLQTVVDRRFRDEHDSLRQLAEFSKQVESGIWVVDRRLALERLLEEAVAALGAVGGQISWAEDGVRGIATRGQWTGDVRLSLSVGADDAVEGEIALGGRRNDAAYRPEDARALSAAAGAVARALRTSAHGST
jgi:hypothetical protein